MQCTHGVGVQNSRLSLARDFAHKVTHSPPYNATIDVYLCPNLSSRPYRIYWNQFLTCWHNLQRVKSKVGRKLPPPSNATRTDFKSKGVWFFPVVLHFDFLNAMRLSELKEEELINARASPGGQDNSISTCDIIGSHEVIVYKVKAIFREQLEVKFGFLEAHGFMKEGSKVSLIFCKQTHNLRWLCANIKKLWYSHCTVQPKFDRWQGGRCSEWEEKDSERASHSKYSLQWA